MSIDLNYGGDAQQPLPSQTIHFDDIPLSIEAVVNDLAQDVILVRFKCSIAVFQLKQRIDTKEDHSNREQEPVIECLKIHELKTDGDEWIQTVGLSPSVSLHHAYQKLRFAFSIYNSPLVYVADFEEKIPEVLSKRQFLMKNPASLDNQASSLFVKFDKDQSKYLACLTDAPSCNVWDCQQRLLVSSVTLPDKGISLAWHSTDPFKVMVGCRDGHVIFYNFVKQQTIQSISVGKAPVLSVDWAPSSNHFIGCSSHTSIDVINLAKPYSSQFRTIEAHPSFTTCIKFCPSNAKVLATSSRSDGCVKLFRLHQHALAWSTSLPEIQHIEWTGSGEWLITAAGKKLCFFRSLQ